MVAVIFCRLWVIGAGLAGGCMQAFKLWWFEHIYLQYMFKISSGKSCAYDILNDYSKEGYIVELRTLN